MKKLFTFMMMLGIMAIAIVAQGQVTYTATFNGNNLSFESVSAPDGNTYSQVLLSGVIGNTSDAGKPQLPLRTLQLMIPFGKEVTNIVCSNIVTQSFQLNHNVYPAPTYDATGQVFAAPDLLVYQSDNAFPAQPIMGWRQDYFDGNNNIVSVGLCPFEYYPKTGLLKLITSVTITVTYANGLPGGVTQIQRLQTTQNLYDSILYHMVDNPEVIPTFRIAPTIVEELGNTSTNLPVYEYVVVAPRYLIKALHDFVTWKNQKGYQTGVVAIEDILTAYPNGDQICMLENPNNHPIVDDAGSLRQYLHDAHELGTAYALLVGDASIMPIRMGGRVVDGNFPQAPTDMYFSDLQGNWNVNNNEFYGELEENTDTPSCNPDIFVGRLLCTNSEEIGNWSAKLLQYEKNPGENNLNYLRRALVTEYYLGLDYSEFMTILNNSGLIVDLISNDSFGSLPSPSGSNIVSQINQTKYGFMVSINQGFTDGLANGIKTMSQNRDRSTVNSYLVAQDAFDMTNCFETGNGLDNLTNDGFPFVMYGIGSSLSPFDISNSVTGVYNFGESFTIGGSYGGVAFLGYTRRSIPDDNGILLTKFTHLVTSSVNSIHYSHIGVSEANSKLSIPTDPSYNYHAFAHNLIGDPECQMWTDVPNRLSMTVNPNYLDKEVSSSVEVVVTGFKTPYSDRICRVTLYSENDVFKIMDVPVDALGYATAVFDSIFPVEEGYITATATCYNHIPAQKYIPVYGPECEIHITSDTTWNVSFATCCDVIIHPNATLTITCDVAFCPICKVKVLPGGKLVLDGSRLFCAVPDHQWQGVRVYGADGTTNTGGVGWQGWLPGYNQGFLEMKNNAEISCARVAVDLWDGINFNTTGGIVHAKDASFSNNGMAVRALYFQNVNPITENVHLYNAYFDNCCFAIDKGYPKEGEVFHHHVVMAKVNGIKFKGCIFYLQDCPAELCAPDNAAIFSFNANFFVLGYCPSNITLPCPDENLILSRFSGFYMGINAINDGNGHNAFNVDNTWFSRNNFGIRTNFSVFPTVLHSTFITDNTRTCSAGIYLDNTSVFEIKDNVFNGTVSQLNNTESFGTVIINSQGINNIYRNNFTDMTCANYSDMKNRTSLFSTPNGHGLEYNCNTCTHNIYDFFIPRTLLPDDGIQLTQGSLSLAAGNLFSANASYQFYNGAPTPITYYQYVGDPDQTLSSYYNVVPVSSRENECPDNYVEGQNLVLSPEERQQREMDYYNAYNNYIGTKILYESYIDGGNTSGVINDITTATPDDMWTLRSQLLGYSPFVSSNVMKTVSDKPDVFSTSVMFEIFAANPEELRRDTLLDYLESRETLPEYLMNTLKDLANSTATYKSVLDARMASYQHEYNEAANDIIRSILNDSVMDRNELRGWLSNLEDINADRQIIASYMEEGNESTAFALANLLPSLYGLTGAALNEHNGYMQLLVLNDTLYKQHRTVFELTESETAIVDSLATFGVGIAQVMAENILEANGGPTMVNCPQMVLHDDIGDGGRGKFVAEDLNEALGFTVNVSPNPATTWMALDFTLPNKITKASFTLTNILGVEVLNVELNGNQGQRVMDLRHLSDGVYVYTVSCAGLLYTGKLVITK